MQVTSELHHTNCVRITSKSYVRLTLESYIIKPCKWNQKIMKHFPLEATSGFSYKNHVRITSVSYVRVTSGKYVKKPCKWKKKIHDHYVITCVIITALYRNVVSGVFP